jgi:hypothetical protein
MLLIVFSGCSGAKDIGKKEITNTPKANRGKTNIAEYTINDYFPFKENTIMDYESVGNEFAEQTVFFEYIEGNKAQMKIFNPGTVVVKVLENSEGELKEIYSEGEFYHIENVLNKADENNTILLKEPLKPGTSWTIPGGHKRAITGVDVDLELPYGKVKALEVVTQLGDGRQVSDYYVREIGHVATIYKDGEFVVETLLGEIKNSPYKSEIVFYYPSHGDIETVYMDRDIEFNTNDDIKDILEYDFKNPPSEKLISPISQNTKINSLTLESGNGIVRADFSKELVSEMNAGSGFEYEILRSITNTLGDYYGVDKVYISIEGRPYASGHYEIGEDEFFEVDKEGIKEFKEPLD